MAVYINIITDRLRATVSVPRINQAHLVVLSTRLIARQIVSPRYVGRLALRASIIAASSIAIGGKYHLILTTRLLARTAVSAATRIVTGSVLRLAAIETRIGLGLAVVEVLRVTQALAASAMLRQPVTAAIVLAPRTIGGWLKAASDRLRATATASDRYQARLQAAERVTLATAQSTIMIVQVVDSETIDFDDGPMLIRALYRNRVFDLLDFLIETRQPNGTITTWAVNTRTGAVTEYLDYGFDSFVRLPDGSYLGAGLDGNLYALSGDTDAGVPIVADMVGGLLDMGGTRFTQLKAVYLGVRAGGRFYLRIMTNNSVVRTYEVSVKPMRTARFDIGKGLRSRYIQWELITTGQDFDLEGIEFIPLVSQRRI